MKKTYRLASCILLILLMLLASCSNDDNTEAKGLLSVDLSIPNQTVTAPEITGATTFIILSRGDEKITIPSLVVQDRALSTGTWHVEARVSNDTTTYYAYDGDVLIENGKSTSIAESILPVPGGEGNLNLTLSNDSDLPLTGNSFMIFNCSEPEGSSMMVEIGEEGKIVASALPTGTYCFICNNSTPFIGFFSILSGIDTTASLTVQKQLSHFNLYKNFETILDIYIDGPETRRFGKANTYGSSQNGIWIIDSNVSAIGNAIEIPASFDKGCAKLEIITFSDDLSEIGFASMDITTRGETLSYINVPGSVLALNGNEDQYSMDNGSNWIECSGTQIPVEFENGNHVLVRKGDDGIISDLGIVTNKDGKVDIVLQHPAVSTYVSPTATSNTPTEGQNVQIELPYTALGSSYDKDFTFDAYLYQGNSYTEEDKVIEDATIKADELDNGKKDIYFEIPFGTDGKYTLTIIGDNGKNTAFCSSDRSTSTSFEVQRESSEGAFIVYNSWGSSWLESSSGAKDGGYYYLPFNRLKEMSTSAYPITNATSFKPKNSLIATFKVDSQSHNIQKAPLTFIVRDEEDEEICRKGFLMGGKEALTSLPYFTYPQYTLTYDLSELTKDIESGYTITLEKATDSAEAVTISDFSINLVGKLTKEYTAKPETPDTITFDDISDRKKDESKGVMLMDEKTRPITEEEAERLFYSMPETPTVIDGHGTGLVRPESVSDLMGLKVLETGDGGKAIDPMYLDKKLDLREMSYMPPIGDQKNVGSCVAFSMGYYDMTAILAKQNGWNLSGITWQGIYEETDPNLAHIMSPAFPYHLSNGGHSGLAYVFVQNLLCNTGISSWETMGSADVYDRDPPENEKKAYTRPSEEAFKEAINNRIWNDYEFEEDNYAPMILYLNTDQQIMKLINILETSALPVTFAINSNNLYNGMSKSRILIGEIDNSSTDHAQTIVGYVTGSEWEKIKNPTP